MFKTTVELDLACSVEQAFRHIACEFFENHPRWDPDIVELTRTSQGPVGVDTTGREVRVMDGRRYTTEFRITEFRPDQAFALRTTAGAMAEDANYLLWSVEDGARLQLRLHIHPRNPFLWLLAPMIRPRIERNFQANMARFQQVVNTTAARPTKSPATIGHEDPGGSS
jgi:hypothetical protein